MTYARCRSSLVLSLAVWMSLAALAAAAGPNPKQREQIGSMYRTLVDAGKLYRDGKTADAVKKVTAAQEQYNAFDATGDKATQDALDRIYRSLANAHGQMLLDGVSLPKLERRIVAAPPDVKPEDKPETPTTTTPKPTTPTTPAPDNGMVSFSKHVAPILLGKCGRCHVNDSKGKFNMGTFTALMKGSEDGRVVFAGDPVGSRLVEVIETGDMPRGGGKVSPAELDTLKKWITEGAKDDGPAADTPLATLASTAGVATPMANTPPPPKVETVKATREGPSFGRDVALVLSQNCMGCHGTNNPRAMFSLATFPQLVKGGDSGPPIVPGKAAESLLIRKLRGQSGARMPLNRPALPDDVIAKIEAWIAAGAKFDGPSQTATLDRVAAVVKAATATHEELTADREMLANSNWKLALPDIESHTVSTENFLVKGNISEEALKELGDTAEAAAPEVAKIFNAPAGEPLVRGRMTLFAVPQRYDYTEFGKMVESRDLPRQWNGHWRYDAVDAYGVLIPPRGDAFSVKALIAQQLAGVYVASQGAVPPWFAEGSARVVASRLAPKDPRVVAWEAELTSTLGLMTKPDDFLTGKLSDEQVMLVAHSFVDYLMKDAKRYQKLLASLKAGDEFDPAFAAAYGGPPAAVANQWASKLGRKGR